MLGKQIFYQWRSFLENELLIEISLKKLKNQFPDANLEYELFPSNLKGNVNYLDVIRNTLEDNKNNEKENPTTEAFIEQFKFYRKIENLIASGDKLTVNIPVINDFATILHKFDSGNITATFEDIKLWQEKRIEVLEKGNKKENIDYFESVLLTGEGKHFDLITESAKWLVYRPKTIAGSKAIARAYWNGTNITLDRTYANHKGAGDVIGEMKWCTNAVGDGNYFYKYNTSTTFLVYFIKKKTTNNDNLRKVCMGFVIEDEEIELEDEEIEYSEIDDTHVDGNNDHLSLRLRRPIINSIPGLLNLIKSSVFNNYKNFTMQDYLKKEKAFKEKIAIAKRFGYTEQSCHQNFTKEIIIALTYSTQKNEIVGKLLELNNEEVIKYLLYNSNCPEDIKIKLMRQISDKKVIIDILNTYKNLPANTLSLFLKFNDLNIIKKVLDHKNCNDDIKLNTFNLYHNNYKIISYLLTKNLPLEVLKKIIDLDEDRLTIDAIRNNNFPKEMIQNFIHHSDYNIQKWAMTHSSTPLEAKINFVNNDENDIEQRVNVAMSKDYPIMLFKRFFNSIKKLDWDWCGFFYSEADKICHDREKLLFFINIFEKYKSFYLCDLLESNYCPEDILETMSENEEPEVREAVAKNQNTSEDILDILIGDDDDNVRAAADENLYYKRNWQSKHESINKKYKKKLNESLIRKYIKLFYKDNK